MAVPTSEINLERFASRLREVFALGAGPERISISKDQGLALVKEIEGVQSKLCVLEKKLAEFAIELSLIAKRKKP